MKNASKALLILGLTTVLSACGSRTTPSQGSSEEESTPVSESSEIIPENVITESQDYNNYGLRGRKYRGSYNSLTTQSIASLNYLTTQEQANAQHFANFIDGLLLHNDFGVLEKNLATEIKRDEEFTKFQIKIKQGVKWQNWDGSQYLNKNNEPQFVSAKDWVASAKAINTYANKSDLQYLIGTFVKGTTEYFYYTRISYDVIQGTEEDVYDMDDHAAVAAKINKYIKAEAPQVWELEYDNGANAVEADDVPNIANGSRFGVKADGDTLTYNLNQPAPYFPTLFTYSAYMPVNEDFLTATKFSKFGTTKDSILYCGPYLLDVWSALAIKYKANEGYHNKENTITIDEINYRVIQDTSIITPEYTRSEFEAGRIDGFSLNKKDGVGWTKYITGPDGTGTYDNPYDAQVNARLLDQIGSMYGSNLVLERDNTGKTTSYATGGNGTTVKNTARAFRLNDVRKAILEAPDFKQMYDVRNESTEEELRAQEKVYTYVPKGFVMDDDGNDYLDHYYEVYADKKGIAKGDIENPVEGNNAAWLLRPGQVDTCTLPQEEVNALIDNAVEAIGFWNADHASEKITLPIQLEYYSLQFDDESKEADDKVIANLNKRLNKGAEGSFPYFKVIPTDKLTSANYNAVSRSGEWDLAYIQWGWGADYGDPLSFMNTYCKYGDWGDVFPYIDQAEVKNYVTNAARTGLEAPVDLLANYTALVKEGAQQTNDFNARFDKFAEAEYMLINELNIYKPQVNNGQGWAMSVSKAAGYYTPQANYGLSSDRLTGMFVLEEVMTRTERQAARDKQTELKEAYVKKHGSINIYNEDNYLIDD